MSTILLTSKAIYDKEISKKITRIISKYNFNFKGKHFFYLSSGYVATDNIIMRQAVNMGFEFVHELNSQNIERYPFDVLYVNENSNALDTLHKVMPYKSLILSKIRTPDFIYIGCSSGAVIVGPDIRYIEEIYGERVGDADTTGLNIIQATVFPHYTKNRLASLFLNKYFKEDEETGLDYKKTMTITIGEKAVRTYTIDSNGKLVE